MPTDVVQTSVETGSFPLKAAPRTPHTVRLRACSCDRDGGSPPAVPVARPHDAISSEADSPLNPADSSRDRVGLINQLSARIRAIEGRAAVLEPVEAPDRPVWRLGVPEIDRRLGPGGLETGALHELKPSLTGTDREQAGAGWSGAVTATLAFTLLLCRLRLTVGATARERSTILWCWPSFLAGELGRLYAPGLEALGIAATRLVVVEPSRSNEVLWAMEEGLRSAAPSVVVGVLDGIGLTPARRLALAAAACDTPCLAITDPRSPAAGATSTRWRIGRALSAPHPLAAWFPDVLPGAPRYRVALERSRAVGVSPLSSSLVLEWSDETSRFRLVSPSADRAPAPDDTRRIAEGGGG